ncbi:MAG: UbiA family prenyltransferase [Coriobacteriia bacterium]|nr:UbiA family prenyltransferase [Coriobacteriia bacterium]
MRCGASSGLASGGGAGSKVGMLLELVKFEHSIFALPYAYVGALYGAAVIGRWPTWAELVWITVAMVGARAFAFVLNRAADKEIDARNPRTAGRAVPAGLIKAGELWAFAAVMLAAFLFAVWQLHPITRWLWPIVLAAFIIYPYTKRFTWLCHYWLGFCLGLAPVGAWVAVGAPLGDPAPWVFGAAVTFWTAGFDIIYATQDVECDVRDGVHSVPADLGVAWGLLMTRVVHVLTVVLLLAGGVLVSAGWPYYAALAVAAILLAYENSIISPGDLSRVNAAFFTLNGVIAITLFAGVLADRLLA